MIIDQVAVDLFAELGNWWLLICSPSLAIDSQTFRHHSRRHLQCAVGWRSRPRRNTDQERANQNPGYSAKAALCRPYKRRHKERNYPTNSALKMSPRMVTKRLRINCQARRTDQQPPDRLPISQ
ncbi:hypothetical protein T265_09213 [Opisthorchis viverrini]|uniref:Uncharacterized protein n=1 Tax=Opisthorchis viverrini TaxID=6198 RepID=A0A074ZHP1_OPIVI|nr:hypothetical protein T265_09213 [Opisthorchis viverrini]KER22770.1 hypothetical protein T265_09213 [Opisthorchis viverrini]